MEDLQDLADKYKLEKEAEKKKFDNLNKFVYDRRHLSIQKSAEHRDFVKHEFVSDDVINQAQKDTFNMNYS